MSDQPENLMLVYRRRLDGKMESLVQEVADLKQRMTAVEIQLGSVAATEQSHYASLATRLDRQDARLKRIERSLDLTEASVS